MKKSQIFNGLFFFLIVFIFTFSNSRGQSIQQLIKEGEALLKLARDEKNVDHIIYADDARIKFEEAIQPSGTKSELVTAYVGLGEANYLLGKYRNENYVDYNLAMTNISKALNMNKDYIPAVILRGKINYKLYEYYKRYGPKDNEAKFFEKAENDFNSVQNDKLDDESKILIYTIQKCKEQKEYVEIIQMIAELDQNTNDSLYLKILYDFFMSECDSVMENYLLAIKYIKLEKYEQGLSYLELAKNGNCNFFVNKINQWEDSLQHNAEIFFQKALVLALHVNDKNYYDVLNNLEKAFTLDSSCFSRPFILRSNLPSKIYFSFAKLYLNFSCLSQERIDELEQIRDNSSKPMIEQNIAIFLLIVNHSRNSNIPESKIIEGFLDILKCQPSFIPYYFKEKSDIPARYCFAEAINSAMKLQPSPSDFESLVNMGKSICDSILILEPNHKGARRLQDNFNSNSKVFKDLKNNNKYIEYGAVILIFVTVFLGWKIMDEKSYTNGVLEHYEKNPEINKQKLIEYKYTELANFLNKIMEPLKIKNSKEDKERGFIDEWPTPIGGDGNELVINFTEYLFEEIKKISKKNKLYIPDNVSIEKNNIKFYFSKFPKIKNKKFIILKIESNRYGIKNIIRKKFEIYWYWSKINFVKRELTIYLPFKKGKNNGCK